MGLIDFPNPVGMFEGAKTSGLEREVVNALVSSQLSSWINFLWTLGKKNLFGLGPALQAMATAQYLALISLEKKNFLTLTVSQDLLNADNLSKYQTQSVQ